MRAGIVGYGLAGRFFHAAVMSRCGFEISGVVTTQPERIRALHSDHPTAIQYATVQELIESKPDVIVVATTNAHHASIAVESLHAGIPVVVEKPIARTHSEAMSIEEASQSSGTPWTAFYCRRWDSEALTTKRVIESGEVGEVFRIETRFDRWRPQVRPGAWREVGSDEEGGGLLLDLQTHLISQALLWSGAAKVAYADARRVRGAAIDDCTIMLRHENGVQSTLTVSAVSGLMSPKVRVFGTQGTLVIDGIDPQEYMLRDGLKMVDGKWTVPAITPAWIQRGEERVEITPEQGDYGAFYRQVFAALSGKAEWPISPETALSVTNLIEQARTWINQNA